MSAVRILTLSYQNYISFSEGHFVENCGHPGLIKSASGVAVGPRSHGMLTT
jgi:hypothetical protein